MRFLSLMLPAVIVTAELVLWATHPDSWTLKLLAVPWWLFMRGANRTVTTIWQWTDPVAAPEKRRGFGFLAAAGDTVNASTLATDNNTIKLCSRRRCMGPLLHAAGAPEPAG